MNQFDGAKTEDAMKQLLNSRCPHGYSKRKNCSKCQRRLADAPKAFSPERSVYETRNANHP